jgi:hypothetical protein
VHRSRLVGIVRAGRRVGNKLDVCLLVLFLVVLDATKGMSDTFIKPAINSRRPNVDADAGVGECQ